MAMALPFEKEMPVDGRVFASQFPSKDETKVLIEFALVWVLY
jgi:hypothetical protein